MGARPILCLRFLTTDSIIFENATPDVGANCEWNFNKNVDWHNIVLQICIMMYFIFQDPRYKDDVDRIAGYTTDSLLCLPIKNTDDEIIGVAQVINKRTDVGHAYFLRDDEKVNVSHNP